MYLGDRCPVQPLGQACKPLHKKHADTPQPEPAVDSVFMDPSPAAMHVTCSNATAAEQGHSGHVAAASAGNAATPDSFSLHHSSCSIEVTQEQASDPITCSDDGAVTQLGDSSHLHGDAPNEGDAWLDQLLTLSGDGSDDDAVASADGRMISQLDRLGEPQQQQQQQQQQQLGVQLLERAGAPTLRLGPASAATAAAAAAGVLLGAGLDGRTDGQTAAADAAVSPTRAPAGQAVAGAAGRARSAGVQAAGGVSKVKSSALRMTDSLRCVVAASNKEVRPARSGRRTTALPKQQHSSGSHAAAAAAAACMPPPPPVRQPGKHRHSSLHASMCIDVVDSRLPGPPQQSAAMLSGGAPQLSMQLHAQHVPLPYSSTMIPVSATALGGASKPAAAAAADAEAVAADGSCAAGYSWRDLAMAWQLVQLMQMMFEEQQQVQGEWYNTEMATHGVLEQQLRAQRGQLQALQQQMAALRGSLVAQPEAGN